MVQNLKRIAGWRAQREGLFFEAVLARRANASGMSLIRIPDGCTKRGSATGRPVLIAKKTPFDFILGYESSVCFLDAKSWDADRVTYSSLVAHQVCKLNMLSKHQRAGYLCHLRVIGRVVFFEAPKLAMLKPKSSLRHSDGVDLGTFEDFDLKRIFQ